MTRPVLEDHFNRLGVAIDDCPPVPRQIDGGTFAGSVVCDEDAIPAPGLGQLPRVDDDVREPLEEDPRFDFVFRTRRNDVEGDLAEGLVPNRNQHHVDVGGSQGARRRYKSNRAEQPIEADAARLHRHELPVRRKPPEGHEQRQKKRHRNRQRKRVRQERHDQPSDGQERDPLRHVFLGVPHQLGNDEEKREDGQAKAERPGHLTKDVAVESAHQRSAVLSGLIGSIIRFGVGSEPFPEGFRQRRITGVMLTNRGCMRPRLRLPVGSSRLRHRLNSSALERISCSAQAHRAPRPAPTRVSSGLFRERVLSDACWLSVLE